MLGQWGTGEHSKISDIKKQNVVTKITKYFKYLNIHIIVIKIVKWAIYLQGESRF